MSDVAPISVVIPAYNAQNFIAEALRSVAAQTRAVAEVIVVDDGSADQTATIAERCGARVLRQINAGPSAARNAGIRAATQPWIAFLDADDLWLPEKINLQWRAIQLCPDVGIVAGDYRREENGRITMPSRLGELKELFTEISKTKVDQKISYFPQSEKEFALANLSLTPSAMLLRRDLLVAVGLFDESLHYWEDNECFLKILARCALALVEEPVMTRRVHDGNATNNALKYQLGRIAVADRLHAHPEIYPPRAAQIYEKRLLPFLVPTGRLLMEEERTGEARALFARRLRAQFELRALALWIATWIRPRFFKRLAGLKRLLTQRVSGKAQIVAEN